MKPQRVPERDIQRSIQDWCKASGVVHWRVPLAGVINRRPDGSAFMATNSLTGFPDLAGIRPDLPGALWVCEVKAAGGKLSAPQIMWRDRLIEAGVLYILAFDVGEFVHCLARGRSKPGRSLPI